MKTGKKKEKYLYFIGNLFCGSGYSKKLPKHLIKREKMYIDKMVTKCKKEYGGSVVSDTPKQGE